jgi:hypothetical protein
MDILVNKYSQEHDKPFDLQEASGRVRSEPRHFVEHVLNVLLMLRSNPDIQLENEIEALKCISKLVAANVAFSAYRKKEGIVGSNLLNLW